MCDLSWVAERSEKLVSHHVRALRAAGLVRSRRDGKMVMYALTDAGRALLGAVLGESGVVSAPASCRCCRWRRGREPEPERRSAVPSRRRGRYRVEGMDCAACAQTVEKVVAALDGVRAAQVSFGNATLAVEATSAPERVRRRSRARAIAQRR